MYDAQMTEGMSTALCQCGHSQLTHRWQRWAGWGQCQSDGCGCVKYAPPTREPIKLTDEELAQLETWDREGVYACPHTHRYPTPGVCREKYGLFAAVESILAARLAGAEGADDGH